MSLLSAITQKYEYNYFDKGNLCTKQLNIFQCFFRRWFGCYAETHLSNVAKRAYVISFDQESFDVEKSQKFLKLIAKAQEKFGEAKSWMPLSDYGLPSGTKVSLSVHYSIEECDHKYKLSSVDFSAKIFQREGDSTYAFSFFKDWEERIIARLPASLFQGKNNDTEKSINEKLSGERAKIINGIIGKILTSTEHPFLLHYYGTNYKQTNSPSYGELNKAQEDALHQLGWVNLTQDEERDQKLHYGITPVNFTTLCHSTAVLPPHEQKLSFSFVRDFLVAKNPD